MPDITINDRELQSLRNKAAKADDDATFVKQVAAGICAVIIVIIGCVFAWKLVSPKLNLYRAETERRSVIAEQRAISEAAEFAAKSEVTQAQAKADAEVIRATGLAKAQSIIAETLTDEYVRYLYIQAIEGNPNQIIYVPTEAGLPVLEAGRQPAAVPAP